MARYRELIRLSSPAPTAVENALQAYSSCDLVRRHLGLGPDSRGRIMSTIVAKL